jgi:uncharacterized protein (TIGR00369 family)
LVSSYVTLLFMPKIKEEGEVKLENYRYPDQFGKLLGYHVVHIDREVFEATAELKIREDHLSPSRRVHGGVISAFIDFTCGAAVFSTLGARDFCSTVELKVNYLLPLELGDFLIAKASVVYRGKRLCVLQAFIYKQGEKQAAAMASATFNVVTVK